MSETNYKNIEDEKEELPEELEQPFNSKEIDITVESRSLDSIISRIRYKNIDMNTHFQRKGDLWSDAVMSRLIESILIRFPLPAFYFDASDDDNWLIVDGLQRLSAIRRFVLNTDDNYVRDAYSNEEKQKGRHRALKLSNLEYLTDYNNVSFDQLPNTMKRRINEAQVTVYLIKPGTPEDVKYSVFYRINTGGLQLNAQEIRHALNQKGKSAQCLEELAGERDFKDIVKISDKRMQDRELILRYIAFYTKGYRNYKPSMLRFLNDTMKTINSLSDTEISEIRSQLLKALRACYDMFDEDIFSKSIISTSQKSNLNRGLFEVWTVLIAKLDDEEIDNLLLNKEAVVDNFTELLRNPEFDKSITSSTTGTQQVMYRFSAINDLIEKYI